MKVKRTDGEDQRAGCYTMHVHHDQSDLTELRLAHWPAADFCTLPSDNTGGHTDKYTEKQRDQKQTYIQSICKFWCKMASNQHLYQKVYE